MSVFHTGNSSGLQSFLSSLLLLIHWLPLFSHSYWFYTLALRVTGILSCSLQDATLLGYLCPILSYQERVIKIPFVSTVFAAVYLAI